jgi:hypothetical protein
MISALYVQKGGAYWDLADVDPWDEERDARSYAGPHRVVAHPPCARWSKYWWGGPSWKGPPKIKGDDGGCFASALASVKKWGGGTGTPCSQPRVGRAWNRRTTTARRVDHG